MSDNFLPPPLEDLSFVAGKGTAVSFAAIRKAGGVISAKACTIRGKLTDDQRGSFKFVQFAGEQVVEERIIKIKKSGRFDVKVHFLKGRNTLIFESTEDSSASFEIDLFHRSIPREWVESILKALVLVLVVKTFVIQAFFIPTPSMENTLLRQDYILVEKISNLFKTPVSGEIVVFEYPRDPSKDFIKRLVGTGSDVIEVRETELYRNGDRLDEPYVRHEPRRLFSDADHRVNFGPIQIDQNHYFVMGDNRDNSKDSREWGAFPQWQFIGKAWGVYFPITRFGLISHGLGKPSPTEDA